MRTQVQDALHRTVREPQETETANIFKASVLSELPVQVA